MVHTYFNSEIFFTLPHHSGFDKKLLGCDGVVDLQLKFMGFNKYTALAT